MKGLHSFGSRSIMTIILISLLPFVASGQRVIKGSVYAKSDSTAIIGASIQYHLGKSLRGASTDENGYFKLEVPDDRDIRLEIKAPLYIPYIINIAPKVSRRLTFLVST